MDHEQLSTTTVFILILGVTQGCWQEPGDGIDSSSVYTAVTCAAHGWQEERPKYIKNSDLALIV